VIHVDDLIKPRTKQILIAALPTFPWPHRILRYNPRKQRITTSDSWNPNRTCKKSLPEPLSGKSIAGIPVISMVNQSFRDITVDCWLLSRKTISGCPVSWTRARRAVLISLKVIFFEPSTLSGLAGRFLDGG